MTKGKEGSRDRDYERLMVAYKELRSEPGKREESDRILDAALKLREKGLVSQDAITAAQYL